MTESPLERILTLPKDVVFERLGQPVYDSDTFSVITKDGCRVFIGWDTKPGIHGPTAALAAFFDENGECLLSENIIPLKEERLTEILRKQAEINASESGKQTEDETYNSLLSLDDANLPFQAMLSMRGSGILTRCYLTAHGTVLSVSEIGGYIVHVEEYDPVHPN